MTSTHPIDVREMAIIHRTFRRAYEEAARLVRAEPTPPLERVTFLADHIDFAITMLHVHHEGEDELLYPKLIERVPDQAPETERVEHEHELIKSSLNAAALACRRWRERPSVETGEALAAALDRLNAVVQPHLDDEEREVVPLAAVTLTQKEWDALGKHAVGQIPNRMRGVAFGMILEPLDDADRAYMMRVLPPPVRILYPVLVDRPWKKYAAKLRAGA